MEPEQLVALASVTFAAIWFALGAAIGSFLNVVIYRLPRGMSLSRPSSRCPACRHRIRWRDNVPVLGWLWLRGRCRDCRFPISPRYPFVEATVGVAFLLLAVVELYSGGTNLPHWRHEGGLRGLSLPSAGLHVLTLLHGVLFAALVAAAWMDQDGQRVPVGVWLVPAVPLAVTEWLHPAGAWLGLPVGALAGLAVGALYGSRLPTVVGLALIGGYLGWQGAVTAAGAALAAWLVMFLAAPERFSRYPLSPLVPATAAAFAFLLAWRSLI